MRFLPVAVLLCLIQATPQVFGQSPETFEVASIKPADPMKPGTYFRFEPGASVQIEGATLRALILFAYDIRDFQLSGANGWMSSDRYSIRTKGTMAEGPAQTSTRSACCLTAANGF